MVPYRRVLHLELILIALTLLTPAALQAAAGDITAVRIASAAAHNGWVAEIDITENPTTGGTYVFGLSATNDPANAKIVLTVTSSGYNTSGGATTLARTVHGTRWMRKAYPNQAVADESSAAGTLTVRVTLSDFIYSSDTLTATIGSAFYTQGGNSNNSVAGMAVTNNSTLAYPKSVCRWATVPYQQVTGNFLVEAVCFHRHYQAYKPVAAVIFTCSDASAHSVSYTVNDMTVSAMPGDQNTVLVYPATIVVSTLTQGDVITCNFVAYPWVGGSGALVDTSTGSAGNENLGPLLFLNDKSGTYGGAFAVIDSVNGRNSTATTWVYSTQATAESNYAGDNTLSYTTIGNAVQAIKSYNNTNYSRNNAGGGVALLTGNHTYPGTDPVDQGDQNTWLTITRLSTVAKASAVINAASVGVSLDVDKVRLYDISFAFSSGGMYGTDLADELWMHDVAINATSSSAIVRWQLAFATNNTVTALGSGFQHFSTLKTPWGLFRGNSLPSGGITAANYAVIGNKNPIALNYERGNAPGQQFSDNAIYAFNSLYARAAEMFATSAWAASCAGNNDQVIGVAIVQNLIERTTATSPALSLGETSCHTNNVLFWQNTFVGQRENIGYNSTGSVAYYHRYWSMIGNIFDDWNTKGDTFTTADAYRVGGWPVEYNVGSAGNKYLRSGFPPSFWGLYTNKDRNMAIGSNGSAYEAILDHTSTAGGTTDKPITGSSWATWWVLQGNSGASNIQNWAGNTEYAPVSYFSDKSWSTGDAAGNGSYWMGPSSAGGPANGSGLGLLPEAKRPLPYDLAGRPRNAGAAGAYELPTVHRVH